MSGIITVASGKGGTGKTWLALSLAQALALKPGRRVLVVDADWGLANADVQLGMLAPTKLKPGASGTGLAEAIRPVPDANIDLLATASGSGRLADRSVAEDDALVAGVRAIAKTYDWTVIDLAAGAERRIRDWWRLGHRRLVVVTPDPGSLTDAYAFLKLCNADGDARRAQLVVNRAASRDVGDATAAKLDRAARHFLKLPVATAGVLLEEPRVGAAIRAQRPFVGRYPTAPTTLALQALGRRLTTAQKPTAAPSLRLSEPAT